MKYGFAEIDALGAEIKTKQDQMNALLDQLKGDVNRLFATWNDGQGVAAYQVQQREWDNAAAELNLILQAIGGAVTTGNDGMNSTDRGVAAMYGG